MTSLSVLVRPSTSAGKAKYIFQFTVIPFGLQDTHAIFQRLMDQVLAGAEAFSVADLDDIVRTICSISKRFYSIFTKPV